MNIISGPVPAYSNVPINPEYYQPRRFVIEAIQLGFTTVVTTTQDMDYVIGQQVRLHIPPAYKSYQLNNQTGYVISIPETDQVELSINSSGYTPFLAAMDNQQPEIIGIGDINSGVINTNGIVSPSTNVPGAFINISPL